ncbi:insulin-like 3 (Leydig cell) [Polypterus senegalus]|uniref:insulin-like 3 (Leydig cell) n=1 Tax=Polypterus senegalus TaxID=55291 RepID=UPI001965CEB6|nr:insulin-like 3 (Leydig cell) [Polypterus senegalus]
MSRSFLFLCLGISLSALVGSRQVLAQNNRVKLCGREFVRSVVVSCGSPRWKRFSSEIEQPQVGLYGQLLSWLDGNNNLESFFPPEVTDEPSITSQEAGEVQTPFGDEEGSPFHLSPFTIEVPPSSTGSAPSEKWASRTRREASLAGICCRLGCTKSELSLYC